MMNRIIKTAVCMTAVAAMSVGTLAACGSSDSGSDAKGKVYYLNYKPEINDAWKALAKKYTEKTGVEVRCVRHVPADAEVRVRQVRGPDFVPAQRCG